MTQCLLETLPASLLRDSLFVIIDILTDIIEVLFKSIVVPHFFKNAVFRPLLKKTSLSTEVLNNYRPVSDLSFFEDVGAHSIRSAQ